MDGSNLKTFVGAEDYKTSSQFYLALGFQLNWDQGDLAEFEVNGHRFFLQNYYNRDWCNNMMLHMDVADARGWHDKIVQVLSARSYGAARTREPVEESYGALVTHLWDPSGVLWHLAQPLG